MNTRTPLTRYAEFFARMTPADLDRLDTIFADDAHFRDPFNDVRGLPSIRTIFAHMYETCSTARFVVLDCLGEGAVGWIRWRFDVTIRGLGAVSIEGASRVAFNAEGLAEEHLDYWDASELMQRIPVAGWPVRGLRRLLATPTDQG